MWCVVAEDGDVRGVAEDAVALVASGLLQDAQFDETGYKAVGRSKGGAGEFLHLSHRDDGAQVEGFKNAVAIAGGASELRGDGGPVILSQGEDAARGFGGLTTHAGDATQEEGEPLFPVPVIANRLEMFVVFRAVLFEKVGEVKHGLEQYFPLAEEERDQ